MPGITSSPYHGSCSQWADIRDELGHQLDRMDQYLGSPYCPPHSHPQRRRTRSLSHSHPDSHCEPPSWYRASPIPVCPPAATFTPHSTATTLPVAPNVFQTTPKKMTWEVPNGEISFKHKNHGQQPTNAFIPTPNLTPWGAATPLPAMLPCPPVLTPCTPIRTLNLSPRGPIGTPLPPVDTPMTPGTWPPLAWPARLPIQLFPSLVPNPINTYLPLIKWDLRHFPSTATRVSGAHVELAVKSIWREAATYPEAKQMLVHVEFTCPHIGALWGPLVIEKQKKITVGDLLTAIYDYLQTPLSRTEYDQICDMGWGNEAIMEDAFRERCARRVSNALPGWERKYGVKRVDCLGHRFYWCGMHVSFNSDNTWQLHLHTIDMNKR